MRSRSVFGGRINYFCEIKLFKDTKDNSRQKTRKIDFPGERSQVSYMVANGGKISRVSPFNFIGVLRFTVYLWMVQSADEGM